MNPNRIYTTDIRQTSQYADYLRKIGWIVERKNEVNYFIKKIPLIGSVIKIQRPNKIDNKTIKQLIKKYRIFQIIIEPSLTTDYPPCQRAGQLLTTKGYKLSKSPYLPTKTLHLDLTKPGNEILKGMKKDARLAIRKNSSIHYAPCTMHSLKNFRELWKKSVGLKRYVPPLSHLIALKKSFGENASFITNKKDGLPAEASAKAGAIFLKTKDIAYYWQAFTNTEGRRLMSQYRIVWEGILWAKKSGCKVFDFEGIFDERFPNKTWLGFTHFKKSFGGFEVVYPGCYTTFRLTT